VSFWPTTFFGIGRLVEIPTFDVEEPVSELPKRRHTSKADTEASTLTILDREVKEIAAKVA
jgi:hypothetical protein